MRKYLIRTGCTFVEPDGTRKTGGDVIELEDDVATSHPDKLDPAPEPEPEAGDEPVPA